MATRVALSVVLIAAGVVAVQLTPDPDPKYLMVDELVKDLPGHSGEPMRVHGWVLAGSIFANAPNAYTFVLTARGGKVLVHYEGLLPDTFRDQSEIVVLGTLEENVVGYLFEGTQIRAKCATKYDGVVDKQLDTKFQ